MPPAFHSHPPRAATHRPSTREQVIAERGSTIAFVGSRGFADFHGVGGMQSYVRRLGMALARRGHAVDYLIHEAARREEAVPMPGIRLRYFVSLADSLAALSAGGYEDVLRVWFAAGDRLAFLRHLGSPRDGRTRTHYMWFVVSDSPAKRLLGMFEGLATARHGSFFCVSPRQWRGARRWTRRSSLLLPPVPDEYFLRPDQKPVRWPLRITYLGVLHPDKGVHDVVRLFAALRDDTHFDCRLHATHDPHDRDQVDLHQELLRRQTLRYRPMQPMPWSPALETQVRDVLAETDVFVQPFPSLQNTVDTPLLVLEAMASLSVVLTTRIHSIPELYDNPRFQLPPETFVERAVALLKGLTENDLNQERARLYRRNQELAFSQAEIASKFLAAAREGTMAGWP